MIRSVDDKQDADVQRLWEDSGDKYAALYIRLLAKLTRTDTLQQILVLMGDMLAGHDERMQLFLQVKGQDQGNTWPYQPLLKLIEAQDEFCQLKAAQFLTLALTSKRPEDVAEPPPHVLDRLLSFLAALINTGVPGGAHAYTTLPGAGALRPPTAQGGYAEGNGADVAIQLLEALLRSKQYRSMFWVDELRKIGHASDTQGKSTDAKEDGQAGDMTSVLYGLRSILMASLIGKSSRSTTHSGTSTPATSVQTGSTTLASASGSRTPAGSVGVQLVYQVVFCFWLLSFETDIAAELNTKFGIVPVLIDVARNAVKEKVVRVIVATLRNLVENAPNANTSAILGSKGLALMESLAQRKYSDEEIPEDIDVVKKALSEKLKVMSTYDQFLSELSAGRLTWDNPAHSLDDFWKENTTKLLEASSGDEGVNESGLTLLLNIVKNADNASDATSLAIACNDIGKMLQFSPEGTVRKRIEKQGGKAYIMALISHEDGQVKFHALHTVSKLVSASWRG
jgi:V-type H+-transporting ATPase subunit H